MERKAEKKGDTATELFRESGKSCSEKAETVRLRHKYSQGGRERERKREGVGEKLGKR